MTDPIDRRRLAHHQARLQRLRDQMEAEPSESVQRVLMREIERMEEIEAVLLGAVRRAAG